MIQEGWKCAIENIQCLVSDCVVFLLGLWVGDLVVFKTVETVKELVGGEQAGGNRMSASMRTTLQTVPESLPADHVSNSTKVRNFIVYK